MSEELGTHFEKIRIDPWRELEFRCGELEFGGRVFDAQNHHKIAHVFIDFTIN